jgi:hypothetical protein
VETFRRFKSLSLFTSKGQS